MRRWPVRGDRGFWDRIAAGDTRNVDFGEFCRLVEAFDFTLRRVSGSRYIYSHPEALRPVNLPRRDGEAKPNQIKQFLEIMEECGLTMKPRR